jgi:hypothetical protein
VNYLFKEMLLLSNGYCGSACAVFAAHLLEVDNAKSLVFGGVYGIGQQQFFSFPGGEVVDISILEQEAFILGNNTKNPLIFRIGVYSTDIFLHPFQTRQILQ